MSFGGPPLDPDDVVPAPAAEILGPLGLLAPVGLIAGRGVAVLHDAGLTRVLAVPAALLAGATLLLSVLALRAGRARTAAASVLLAMVLVTSAGVLLRLDTFERGLVPALVDRGGTADMEVRVAAEPRKGTLGWQTVLVVAAVDGVATRERVAAVLETAPALGDRLRIEASVRPLPDGGYGRWLTQAHAVALLDVREIEVVGRPGALSRASEHVRQRIRAAATRHLSEANSGLLVGFPTML